MTGKSKIDKRSEEGTEKVSQKRVNMAGVPSCCLSCAVYKDDLDELKNFLDSHDLSDSEVWSIGVQLLRKANTPDRLDEFLLKRAAKSETPLYWNGTPLWSAVEMDSIKIMKMLQANHGINKPTSYECLVPLSMAIQLDDTAISKVLLDHIYRNKSQSRCSNAMNNLETIKSLLHASVNVDERLYVVLPGYHVATRLADQVISEVLNFNVPRIHAVIRMNMAFASRYDVEFMMLLQQNANVKARSYDNLTPLHLAAQLGDLLSAKILLDHGADTSSVCAWALEGLLIDAVHARKAELVKFLLKKGVNVNTSDKKKGTPLQAAVKSPTLFKLLLSNGADIDALGSDNKNVLRRAVEQDDLSLIEVIIEAHSNPKSPMKKTQSEILEDLRRCSFGFCYFYKKDCAILFHKVIQQGHIRIVEYLLNLGTNFNVESKAENGNTPLHSAVTSGQVEIARLLIKNKADVNAKTLNGATPLHYVFNHTPAYSGDEANETPSRTLAKKRTEIIIKILLDKGASVDAKENDGTTVLGRAAKSGHTEAFKLLIENGADIITDGDNNGETLLHMAVAGGSSEIVEMVLNAFDDVNCREGRGESALHFAVQYKRISIVRLLLDHDSDINISGDSGENPLQYNHFLQYLPFNERKIRSKITMILKRHIVKMIALNRYVSEQNLKAINSFDNYERVLDECKGEIESMRQTKINVSNVSYYDVLTKGMNQLVLYAKNKDIVDALDTGDLKHMFPQYSDMLHNRFKKGQKRAGLLDSMKNSLSSLMGYTLPDVVTAKIFDCLSNKDLKSLIRAGFNEEFFNFLVGILSAECRDC